MANYTGNPTATEAPSAPPTPGVAPILSMPTDGDPVNAATFSQPFKVLADFGAWLMKPRATLSSLAEEIAVWRNALLHRRAGYDHQGLPGGLWTGWDEDWCDNGFSPQTVVASGAWGKRWTFQVGVSGGSIAGGGIVVAEQTIGGGGAVAGPRSVLLTMNPFPNPAATAWTLVEATRGNIVVTPDFAGVLEWQGFAGGTSAAVGISGASQLGLSAENTALLGCSIMYRAADTNYQLYTNDGTTTAFTDTGVSIASGPLRFRLEYQGANEADAGAAIASAYIGGGAPVSHAVNLGSFIGRPFVRGRSATNVTAPGSVGILKYRSNLNPGDHFI